MPDQEQTTATTRQAIATRPTRNEIDAETVARLRQQLGLISRAEYAAASGRSIRSLKRDALLRRGPRPIRLGMSVFYKLAEVQAYIDELAQRCA